MIFFRFSILVIKKKIFFLDLSFMIINNINNMFHDPPHDLLSFFNPCHKKENIFPGSLQHDYQQRQQRNALFNQIDRRTVIGF